MIPKGMEYEKAQAKLQEIAQEARAILAPIKGHPGSDVDLIISKLWGAMCSGGEAAYKSAHDSIVSAYKQAAESAAKAEHFLAMAKNPITEKATTAK